MTAKLARLLENERTSAQNVFKEMRSLSKTLNFPAKKKSESLQKYIYISDKTLNKDSSAYNQTDANKDPEPYLQNLIQNYRKTLKSNRYVALQAVFGTLFSDFCPGIGFWSKNPEKFTPLPMSGFIGTHRYTGVWGLIGAINVPFP